VNGSYSGPGEDFAPLQVAYPGDHPTASASEDYVAYSIPGLGTTHIGIVVPSTCAPGAPCIAPLELITVHAVAPPLTTATVTGQLTRLCGTTCFGPAPNATISFHDQAGKSVDGIKTDVFGDYVAELPPGTWIVSSTPTPLHLQHPTLTVRAGDIVIEDVTVSSG
jgi:hypothetical protein